MENHRARTDQHSRTSKPGIRYRFRHTNNTPPRAGTPGSPACPLSRPTEDIQTVLQRKLTELQTFEAQRQNTLAVAVAKIPLLVFTAANPEKSASVRKNAAAHKSSISTFVTGLHTLGDALNTWRSALHSRLEKAQAENDHQRVDKDKPPFTSHEANTYQKFLSALQNLKLPLRSMTGSFNDHVDWFLKTQMDPFAPAATPPSGTPDEGLTAAPIPANHLAAYASDKKTQASLFFRATPNAYNLNHKRFVFANASFVDIQAHRHKRIHSDHSEARSIGLAATEYATDFSVLATGTVTPNGATKIHGNPTAFMLPHDTVWQGYTARYYPGPHSSTPSHISYFYGMPSTSNPFREIQIQQSSPTKKLANFAEQYEKFNWSTWWIESAAPRKAAFDGSGLHSAAGQTPLHTEVQQLVQAMAGFAPDSASQSASLAPEESPDRRSSLQMFTKSILLA